MKAIILAAGRGSRMGNLTQYLPKCRTRIFGKELIEWQFNALNHLKIEEIGVVVGYLKETFHYKLRYFDNQNWFKTNMVSSLISSHAWLEENDCIISYSDIIYSKKIIDQLVDAEI